MTEKEFRRLRRGDLLQLLLAESRENNLLTEENASLHDQLDVRTQEAERLRSELADRDTQLSQLWARMDAKFLQLEQLRRQLEARDVEVASLRRQLRESTSLAGLQLDEVGSIAEAVLRVNGVFETAQRAADQFLAELRIRNPQAGGSESRQAAEGAAEPAARTDA